jgi:hypothetical protein
MGNKENKKNETEKFDKGSFGYDKTVAKCTFKKNLFLFERTS